MKLKLIEIPGAIVAPKGFLATGVFCDIKRLGTGKGSNKGPKRDLALLVSTVPAAVAGMFTTNQICAAPVKLCLERVRGGMAQAIVVNSGNANACTGRQGWRDACAMTQAVAAQLHMPMEHVLVGSTGRIGVNLPMRQVKAGILESATSLGNRAEDASAAAEAIMTSDTRPKQIAVEFEIGGERVRIGGMCKGAGMIQPGMSANGARPPARPAPLHATMLCFLTTDAAIESRLLQQALREAVANSFNRITVDGDMSTNDTVLILANGLAAPLAKAGAHPAARNATRTAASKFTIKSPKTPSFARFQAALNHVCLSLARMIVRDGEGVDRVVTVRVSGARNAAEADAAARAVANSALVKTSWHGGDPNWGRIIDALGYSSARVVENKVDIGYSAPDDTRILWSLRRGQPTKTSFRALCAMAAPKEFELHIRLNLGRGHAVIYAADLTEDYVDFNKGDVSDPTTLGG
jgi:glutamate N-acetyltransferase/amino-acid N-acetyltransferase